MPKAHKTKTEPNISWRPKEPFLPKDPEISGGSSKQNATDHGNTASVDSSSLPEEQDFPHTSPTPPPATEKQRNPSYIDISDDDPDHEAMANFPVNPQPFLIAGLTVDHGWNRPARGRMALGGEPTREHEDYAIITINPMPQNAAQLRPTLNVACDFLEHTQRVRVTASHLSPLGLGLIRLRTVAQRDNLSGTPPFT